MKENGDDHLSYSMEDHVVSSLDSPSFRSSRPNSTCSIPKNLSHSPSISSPKKLSSTESQAKSSEDLTRRKNSHKFSPPPPPLPLRKSVLMKSNSNVLTDAVCSEKQLGQSVISVPTQELSETELDKP
ncbi:protein BNI1-like [Forsythia ovata]|uniref:Protein BNI1-like n=1 Tax=Forsythia ovata TaxID=205694 RepID=A0ABD1PKM9_9LAMI